MKTAKVLKQEYGTITIGFDDGTCMDVPADGLYVDTGTVVDVYTQGDGDVVLLPHESAGFWERVTSEFRSDHKVGKTAYILLALFLGGLGLHKFYAKKYIMGVAYVFFCWTFIPSFIAFIEAIIAIFKPCDSNGDILV